MPDVPSSTPSSDRPALTDAVSELRPAEGPSEDEANEPAPPSLGRASLHILLSIAVFVLIGYFTFDADSFRQMLSSLSWGWLGLALLTLVIRVWTGAWRLSYVSHGRLNLWHGLRGQIAWDFFSNITPSAVGGGPVATLFVARDQKMPLGQATSIILFSSLLDQIWLALTIPLTLFAAVYIDVFPSSLGRIGTGAFIAYFLAMLAWVMVFGYATMIRPDRLQRWTLRLFSIRFLRRFRSRVARELSQMSTYAQLLREQPPSFFVNGFLLTAVGWLARYALIVCIVWSVYAEFDKLLLFVRSMAMMLGTLVLPTPGGSGGIEGLYVLFLAPLMPATLVAPTLLTWRVLGYYIFIALGLLLSMHGLKPTLDGFGTRAQDEPAALRNGAPLGDGAPAEPALNDLPNPDPAYRD